MNANEYEQQVTSLGNIIARLSAENDQLRASLRSIIYRAKYGLESNTWRDAFREGGPDPDRHDDSGCAGRPDDDEPEYDLPF